MYIIIGASSFIGVYTAKYFLEHGEKVLVTGRSDKFKKYYEQYNNATYINLDLLNEKDFEKLPKENVDGVILLSALLPASENADLKVEENAAQYIKVNTLGTIHVLEYCRQNGINRLLSTISFADVGKSLRMQPPINEKEQRNFRLSGDHAVYVISKNAAADVMEYYNQQHNMKNAWFRLPPVYGVGPHGSLKINGEVVKSGLQIFIEKAQEGKIIDIYGDGSLSRDVVYVKDVAKAFYQAIKSDNTCGLYNISSGKAVTLKEQAEVIAEIFLTNSKGKSKVICHPEMKNNGCSYVFSVEKAQRDFSYGPDYSNFSNLMKDYKMEVDQGIMSKLFEDREV